MKIAEILKDSNYKLTQFNLVEIQNFENLLIPIFEKNSCAELTKMVIDSINLESQSEQLLDIAKTAVEKAIEENEEKAMEFVGTGLEKINR